MKKTTLILALATLASISISNAQLITNFSEAISTEAPWVWNSGTKTLTISGNNDQGLMYPDSAPSLNIGSNTQLQLTLSSLISGSNPGGSFFVSLESAGGSAQASFTWVSFTTSVTNISTFTTSGSFNPASIINWNIGDGGLGGTGNLSGATFSTLTAVPEPSTYALMALGGLVVFFIARRRKAQQA